jgi:MFS family permease
MTYLAALRRFNLNVRLCLISTVIIGLTNFGGIFATILNLYFLRLGFGTQFIGVASFLGSLALVLTCLPINYLDRRFGSRKLLLAGLGINIISSVAVQGAVFVPDNWRSGFTLIFYALNSVGLALYLVCSQPFLAAATAKDVRGHVYSVQAALWPLSGFIGSLLAGFIPGLINQFTGIPLSGPGPYQLTLWISCIISVFAFIVMLPTTQPVPESEPEDEPIKTKSTKPQSTFQFFSGLTPNKIILFLSIIVALQITGEASVRVFMNVYLDKALFMSTLMIGLVLGIGQLIAGIGALLTPLFTARFGNVITYVIFSLAIAACMLPLVFIPTWFGASLGYMTTIMMIQIARPALITIQMESVPIESRASMSAATTMAASFSMGFVGLIGGYWIPLFGYATFFFLCAWLTGLAAFSFWAYIQLPRIQKSQVLS